MFPTLLFDLGTTWGHALVTYHCKLGPLFNFVHYVDSEWTKVFHHNNIGGYFSSPQDALRKNVDNPSANLYSILYKLNDFRSSIGFHFKLCYPELGNYGNGCNEWVQTSNPATDSTITGFIPINLSFTKDSYNDDWGGIGNTGYNEIGILEIPNYEIALIDDAPNRVGWHTPIGSFRTFPPTWSHMNGPKGPPDNTFLYGNTIVELFVKSMR